MEAPELSVYGEAKSEYTRQLCVFLVPSLEIYFLDLLEKAKSEAPSPQRALWIFQTMLQGIPEWNQDKVIRETDAVQRECKCDYLEELLTAVFIAHTKVLSAIRLTTKQKKLQITIPKLEHFLHRVLSDCARSLYTNAYLFADGSSIERQKNLRHVSSLINDSVLQAIRGMLPVKNILKEYLNNDDEEEEREDKEEKKLEQKQEEHKEEQERAQEEAEEKAEEKVQEEHEEKQEKAQEKVQEEHQEEYQEEQEKAQAEQQKVQEEKAQAEHQKAEEQVQEEQEKAEKQPIINIDTKSQVSFTQDHVFFNSDVLEENKIEDIPFAEAENRPDEEEDEEDEQELIITDEELPMEAEELNL